MWMDTMDDTLEAAYEARPWRLYVIEADSGRITCKLGVSLPSRADIGFRVLGFRV